MDGVNKILYRYNPENDVIPSGPMVTWAEHALALDLAELSNRVDKLIAQGQQANISDGPGLPSPVGPLSQLLGITGDESVFFLLTSQVRILQETIALLVSAVGDNQKQISELKNQLKGKKP